MLSGLLFLPPYGRHGGFSNLLMVRAWWGETPSDGSLRLKDWTHMRGAILKDPTSELAFTIEWRTGGLLKHEQVVDDLGWTAQPVDDDPNCLKILEQTIASCCSRVVLTGGVEGQVYLLTCTVGTDKGRVLKQAVVLRIAAALTTGEFDESE